MADEFAPRNMILFTRHSGGVHVQADSYVMRQGEHLHTPSAWLAVYFRLL